jgi:cell wall-associated NlpC family hydrolase
MALPASFLGRQEHAASRELATRPVRAPHRAHAVTHRPATHRPATHARTPAVVHRSTARARARPARHHHHGSGRVTIRARSGHLGEVVAFARAQVGHSYRFRAAGPGAFDCSGLVMMAYRRVGINLPHSAAAIAGRAHSVSRSSARPGDIVVGSGHVGIYMGGGMMIDAGNPRVGVSYRRMYSGLWTERIGG